MTVPATPGSPTTIGRYPVSRRLGAGAFATVWLGRDTDFDVDVAIKVLADNWAADPAIRERFLTEAKFLRRIRDRRVVHVYDIGTLDDGRPYFVMDHLDAGSLEDLRRSGGGPGGGPAAVRRGRPRSRGAAPPPPRAPRCHPGQPAADQPTRRFAGRRGRRSGGGPFGDRLLRRRHGRRYAVLHGPRAGRRRRGRRSGRRLRAVRGGVRAADRRAAVPGADRRRPDAGRPTSRRRRWPHDSVLRPPSTGSSCPAWPPTRTDDHRVPACWPTRSTSSPTSWSACRGGPARQAAHLRADYATKPRRLFRSRPSPPRPRPPGGPRPSTSR